MGTRNFGLTGVNEPISLTNIRGEFSPSGPLSFSSYKVGGGYVPRHERNFFIATTSSGALAMSQFTRNDVDASAPSAERNYTARITAGTGAPSIPYGELGISIGWDYGNWGELEPGDFDPASPDLIGINPSNEQYASMQGVSWSNVPADPEIFLSVPYTQYIFFVYDDHRYETLGYNFFDTLSLYSWNGTTAILEKILTRSDGGTLYGSSPGVTYWTWIDLIDTPFTGITVPNQYIVKIVTNVTV